MTHFEPAYLKLLRSGELKERVKEAYRRLEACHICPRECGVNRRESVKGAVCRTGERAVVSSVGAGRPQGHRRASDADRPRWAGHLLAGSVGPLGGAAGGE